MGLWKWLLCVVFLAVVFSDVAPPLETIPIEIKHSDLLKIFPDQKDKLKELVAKLSTSTDKEQVAILNDYTDDCLVNLNKFIIAQSLDPLPMPDIEEEFSWKIWPITYHGEMSLKNGWLQGMGTMVRTGDVTLKYQYPYVNIHTPIGFEKILFNYDYKAKFMGIGPSGGLDGSVTGCKFTFDLNLHMVNLKASLDKFKIDNLGSISLKFTGNILVDWMLNIFVSVTIPMVKPIIKIVVQGFCSSLFEGIVGVYNNIVCTVLDDCASMIL